MSLTQFVGFFVVVLAACVALVVMTGCDLGEVPPAPPVIDPPATDGGPAQWFDVAVRCVDSATGGGLAANLVIITGEVETGTSCDPLGAGEVKIYTVPGAELHVRGTVGGDVCPVSPCAYLPFDGDVQLVSIEHETPRDETKALEPSNNQTLTVAFVHQ
jgi:hypothetical protein